MRVEIGPILGTDVCVQGCYAPDLLMTDERLFFRGTRVVSYDLQLSRFVG